MPSARRQLERIRQTKLETLIYLRACARFAEEIESFRNEIKVDAAGFKKVILNETLKRLDQKPETQLRKVSSRKLTRRLVGVTSCRSQVYTVW